MTNYFYSYIGIGSNLGNKQENIQQAYNLIGTNIGSIKKYSEVYSSPPWGFESLDDFYNSMILVETLFSSHELLTEIKKIEQILGRDLSPKIGYSSRIIDIDIIDYNGQVLETNVLFIPHPHLEKRNFVLYPLRDIAKDWIHPKSGKTITDLIKELPDTDQIQKVII
jgi:2-amino-4-hydroxy-6-hydroxymethyldihydropteridine diphosphokinase